MPFPALLVWGAVAAVGVKKGIDAYSDFDKAKVIGEKAERGLNKAKDSLDEARDDTKNEIKECEMVLTELSAVYFGAGAITGLGAGALLSMGAYGAVSSTGVAISGLTCAAATNATLAWLGGGALSVGGFGIAGGMVALGGIVVAPVLAIGGFILASKAEEALTNATDYRAKVDKTIADIDVMKSSLGAIVSAKNELVDTIEELVNRFEACKVDEHVSDHDFQKMTMICKSLKNALNVPIMDNKGNAANITEICETLLEYGDELSPETALPWSKN